MLVRAAVPLGDGGLCRLPTMRPEKVDRGDLVQAFAHAGPLLRRDLLALPQRQPPAVPLLTLRLAHSVEHSAPSHHHPSTHKEPLPATPPPTPLRSHPLH